MFGIHDKALKLLIYKNHLRGHALKIVSHLSISAESFYTALEILSCEYLNERYLVELFVAIDTARPVRENEVSSVGGCMYFGYFSRCASVLYGYCSLNYSHHKYNTKLYNRVKEME